MSRYRIGTIDAMRQKLHFTVAAGQSEAIFNYNYLVWSSTVWITEFAAPRKWHKINVVKSWPDQYSRRVLDRFGKALKIFAFSASLI